MRRMVIGIFLAVVLGVLFVVLCTFVRRPYEKVLLDRFGTLIPQEKQVKIAYNWYFKLPVVDKVVRVDKRLHLFTGPLQQVVTSNKEPVSVRTFAAWRIVDAVTFYQKTNGSDERAQAIMDERLRGLVGQQFGKHQLDEFFNTDEKAGEHTAALEKQIAHEASDGSEDGKIRGLNELGLQIAEVGFSRIAFPPANTEAVYYRMVAELNQKARDYESKGLSEANTIRSQGNQKAKETRALAQAQAEAIKGQGDSEALAIIAGVNNTEATREFYQYWKSLDFLKTSLAKNTILVLSSDSPFLKTLFQLPGKGNGAAAPATRPLVVPPGSGAAAPDALQPAGRVSGQ